MPSHHPISEGDEYRRSLERALSEDGVDFAAAARVLEVLRLTLERNPFGWQKVPGLTRSYFAKTKRVTTAAGFVPGLHVMFSIADDGRVTLLHAGIHYPIL